MANRKPGESVDPEFRERIKNAKTFAMQDDLLRLPVPPLDQTLDKYLRSVRIFMTDEEYEQTVRTVDKLRRGDGPKLQQFLLERASKSKNWLEQWWDDWAYLEGRYPVYPVLNFGGVSPRWDQWPPDDHLFNSVIPRAVTLSFYVIHYWMGLRKELAPVMQHSRTGTPLCMEQFRRLFNTCRIPQEKLDRMSYHFRTLAEDPTFAECPCHMIVQHSGNYYAIDVIDHTTLQVITQEQLLAAFEDIFEQNRNRPRPSDDPVGALTCLDRDSWCSARKHLQSLTPNNRASLKTIERSIFLLSFTDYKPHDERALLGLSFSNDPRYQWSDKSLTFHFNANGTFQSSCDHTPNEAIVTVAMCATVNHFLDRDKFRTIQCPVDREILGENYPKPTPVRFDIDDTIRSYLRAARSTWEGFDREICLDRLQYFGYGRKFCREHRLYPDSVVQLAIQTAYYKLHGKPAATYETASTKQFYHGRTDTQRSCTAEALAYAKAAADPAATSAERLRLFRIALEMQNTSIEECQNGQGIDRHLLGLRKAAEHLGLDDPEIYSDPSWRRSGGDGQYIISTSFLGYTNVYGGVVPMCLDGYGTFYNLADNSMTIVLVSWASSTETKLVLYRDNLTRALDDIRVLMETAQSNSSKL